MKKILCLISILMVTFSVIGCSSSKVDSSKEQATSKDEKQVVVATSVAITEILDRLGVEVSGVPQTSYELPESAKGATEVGSPMNPDMEIIKSLNPTDVICVDTLGSDFEKQFEENNINADFYNLSNVDGLKETIAALGEKFNKQDKANEILDEIKEVEDKVNSNKKSDDKILVLFGAPGSVMVATDKSYIGNLVELAGGNNIFSNATSSFTQINLEEIIKLNPDKILVMTHAVPEAAKKSVEEELSKDLWKNVNAVKNNDITYLENGYFGMSANLQIVEAVEKLGDILYE
ncbi:heme ABC transporter substrate-binding protein IsdE [Intestinibacter bartlettii]|uniref:heme ABC transporter substrate-binding protein IsdE n=1 Tax=Intestinibacter bartlettii TaxID=261299 RepID=UPI001D01D10C|nr:heme ABC transporter substrate-binding protein IsdE [Intestinibacter bartlettii]MCB5719238.1 heme ABC transporter substrate-binding protein IsdE [Intestinibacter bartlettii]